jgi:RNA polymerase sigma-70 factor (ECF subfamily)
MSRPLPGRNEEPQIVRAVERFDDFYLREFPRMVAVAYGLSGSRWAAEELAQEALLRAYKSWSKIATYDKPGAWLRRVTINLATSHVRRRISEAKAIARMAVGQRTPLQAHPDAERAFWDQVHSLPRRQREAVVLHYVDGLTTAEISEVLDVAESTVRTHLQRGRQAVTAALDEGGELL